MCEWVVENGNVSDLSCKTAVHHRKVANHYWLDFSNRVLKPNDFT